MGSASKVSNIRAAVQDGSLQITLYTTKEGERLDQIAGKFYGDGRYWWVIASASNIGWWLQVPTGTRLVVPLDLNIIEDM
tara:strand:+ start:222 stop:461 length:240 start_codon:yes stop_codon:yes gene_type:complete